MSSHAIKILHKIPVVTKLLYNDYGKYGIMMHCNILLYTLLLVCLVMNSLLMYHH